MLRFANGKKWRWLLLPLDHGDSPTIEACRYLEEDQDRDRKGEHSGTQSGNAKIDALHEGLGMVEVRLIDHAILPSDEAGVLPNSQPPYANTER